jgi:hypothetical protein
MATRRQLAALRKGRAKLKRMKKGRRRRRRR